MQTRTETDSLGPIEVPKDALYGAQTERAKRNFPVSGLHFPPTFIRCLAELKKACAQANQKLKHLDPKVAEAIIQAANEVAKNQWDSHFPLDIFQTGSGTSTNMNANEVIAQLASQSAGLKVHPNDHINMSQSSNDVIPSVIHIAASLQVQQHLLPSLAYAQKALTKKAEQLNTVVKTGRTHLMDAMPLTLGQEISGWVQQLQQAQDRLKNVLPRLQHLALGGTAVGTGINAPVDFAPTACQFLSENLKTTFTPSPNYFESLSCQDTIVELSGHLKTLAVSLTKIANDVRWMNSGPFAGLSEIKLPSLQPGSSIMPGKVNPVMPEMLLMVCAQVIGNDATITIGGQSGNFQLNVMLPVIAYNILQSIEIIANALPLFIDQAIVGFEVNVEHLEAQLHRNPILVTALNPIIGYELGAKIAKKAYAENRTLKSVALELTELSEQELDKLLDPLKLTKGG